jgi:lipopolysaccharide heptosyltransferase I
LVQVNILIVKLGSIGDIVHTLPVLGAIRASLPRARVSWVVERRSAELLRGNEFIDDLIEIDTRSLRKLRTMDDALPAIATQIMGMRKHKYDVALELQGLMKSGIIAKISGARKRWGFSRKDLREPASRIFLTDAVDVPQFTHVIRKNLEVAAQALSIPMPAELEFPIYTTGKHREEAERIAASAGERFAILNPAGGWATKLWPAENFGKLADKLWLELGIRSVVVTGPREAKLSSIVRANSRSDAVYAEPSLKGLYELAHRAVLYVGGDTGPTHIAVAAGAPVVGLFGPTEWWRNGSPRPQDICVERTDIACRVNCHRRSCSNWICMSAETETVFEAALQRIAHTSVPV